MKCVMKVIVPLRIEMARPSVRRVLQVARFVAIVFQHEMDVSPRAWSGAHGFSQLDEKVRVRIVDDRMAL